MLTAGTLAVGLAYVGFAASPSLAPACAAALLGGLGNGVQWASLISAVQLMTPPGLQGRMMGAVESLGALCPAIGLTLGGVLVALTSTRTAFLIVGLGACATTIAFMRLAMDGIAPGRGDPPAGDRGRRPPAQGGPAGAPGARAPAERPPPKRPRGGAPHRPKHANCTFRTTPRRPIGVLAGPPCTSHPPGGRPGPRGPDTQQMPAPKPIRYIYWTAEALILARLYRGRGAHLLTR